MEDSLNGDSVVEMFGNSAAVPKWNVAESLRSFEMSFTIFKLVNKNYQLKKKLGFKRK